MSNNRLKIRVWDKVFNRYWTDEEIKENAAWLLFPDNDNIENIEIEQCTGLKDKNGKLIFEGDVLDDDFVVVWADCGWGFKRLGVVTMFQANMTHFEVTGNINKIRSY